MARKVDVLFVKNSFFIIHYKRDSCSSYQTNSTPVRVEQRNSFGCQHVFQLDGTHVCNFPPSRLEEMHLNASEVRTMPSYRKPRVRKRETKNRGWKPSVHCLPFFRQWWRSKRADCRRCDWSPPVAWDNAKRSRSIVQSTPDRRSTPHKRSVSRVRSSWHSLVGFNSWPATKLPSLGPRHGRVCLTNEASELRKCCLLSVQTCKVKSQDANVFLRDNTFARR